MLEHCERECEVERSRDVPRQFMSVRDDVHAGTVSDIHAHIFSSGRKPAAAAVAGAFSRTNLEHSSALRIYCIHKAASHRSEREVRRSGENRTRIIDDRGSIELEREKRGIHRPGWKQGAKREAPIVGPRSEDSRQIRPADPLRDRGQFLACINDLRLGVARPSIDDQTIVQDREPIKVVQIGTGFHGAPRPSARHERDHKANFLSLRRHRADQLSEGERRSNRILAACWRARRLHMSVCHQRQTSTLRLNSRISPAWGHTVFQPHSERRAEIGAGECFGTTNIREIVTFASGDRQCDAA